MLTAKQQALLETQDRLIDLLVQCDSNPLPRIGQSRERWKRKLTMRWLDKRNCAD